VRGGVLRHVWQTAYILWKVLGFHGGGYEECRLLGCCAVWLL
jgi:hypothetical protein